MNFSKQDVKKARFRARWWKTTYLILFPLATYLSLFVGASALDIPNISKWQANTIMGLVLLIPLSMLMTIYCIRLKEKKRDFRAINFLWVVPFVVTSLVILLYLIFF